MAPGCVVAGFARSAVRRRWWLLGWIGAASTTAAGFATMAHAVGCAFQCDHGLIDPSVRATADTRS
jgi:hypothetical protein